jgi:thymidylate kinase
MREESCKRGLVVLIEGMDLAGKTTLCSRIIDELRRTGVSCTFGNNALVRDNPIALRADEYRKDPKAGMLETGALFLAAHLYDAHQFTYPIEGTVHLQDSCWLRTLAYHETKGTRWVPELLQATRHLQPTFDLTFYLTASIESRKARVIQRELEKPGENDAADYLSHVDPERLMRHDMKLLTVTRRIYPDVHLVDTTTLCPDEVFSTVYPQIKALL